MATQQLTDQVARWRAPTHAPRSTRELIDQLARLAGLGLLTVVAMLTLGAVSQLGPVRKIDQAVFDALVPRLQSARGLITICNRLTDLGSVNVTYAVTVAIAVVVAATRRSILAPLLVLTTVAASKALQWAAIKIIDGSVPTEWVIGAAGPYYSGGVVRVVLVSGIAVLAGRTAPGGGWLRRHPTTLWWIPAGLGALEGLTRLVLGRHWPLDIVAGIPIGLCIVALYRRAEMLIVRDA
jgi:membrane-associated phospholipid phosphatase